MKIGRNDLCPCGSGKKYKKCCLNSIKEPKPITYYQYVVVYNGGSLNPSVPLLMSNNIINAKNYNQGSMHLFDSEITPVIPALNYCLHLPRFECDTYDVDTTIIDSFNDIPQNILLLPSALVQNIFITPTLIIYDDNCDNNVVSKLISFKPDLGCVSSSQLSESLLVEHWKKLSTIRTITIHESLEEITCQHLFNDDRRMFLPASFISRQYNNAKKDYSHLLESSNVFSTCAEIIWKQRVHHVGLISCKEDVLNPNIEQLLKENIDKAKNSEILNVVIVLPGIPSRQIKQLGFTKVLPQEEKDAIQLAGYHRAVARQAIYIELPTADVEVFQTLNDIELHCKADKKSSNNKFILRNLKKLGSWFWDNLSTEQKHIILLAKHVTVFSDFPIGLAIIEKTDVPLHNYLDISYRPLSPLTRCLQLELGRCTPEYLNHHCKIIFAECIQNDESNETIRKCSQMLVHSINEICERNSACEIVYSETLTISSLKEFIKRNSDADILIISAHGHYDYSINMSGLMIGEEFWMGNDDEVTMPPIIINSACHTSPRGFGCVSIADLFLRLQAKAVLSSFIPISADRNCLLLARFFSNLIDAINGVIHFDNLLECWTHVIGGNIINELADESSAFKDWLSQKNKKGTPHIVDFMLTRSVNRLHKQTIYQDTSKIVKEMLAEDGLEGKFDNLLSQEDYFSECSFYQWLGSPENILLHD